MFYNLYDVAFPNEEIEIKSKYLNTPWTTKELRKFSKRKQRLSENIWKFDQKKPKKLTKHIKPYSRELKTCEENLLSRLNQIIENSIQNTWKIMKEITGKKKCNNETLPKHVIVDKIEINDAKSIF